MACCSACGMGDKRHAAHQLATRTCNNPPAPCCAVGFGLLMGVLAIILFKVSWG